MTPESGLISQLRDSLNIWATGVGNLALTYTRGHLSERDCLTRIDMHKNSQIKHSVFVQKCDVQKGSGTLSKSDNA